MLGYHLTRTNFNSDAFAAQPSARVPDVVLVRKTYPNRLKKNRARQWKLKNMAKEAETDEVVREGVATEGVIGRMAGRDQKKVKEGYELFLHEIEEDEEIHVAVNLYKAPGEGLATTGGKTRRKGKTQISMDVDGADTQTQITKNETK